VPRLPTLTPRDERERAVIAVWRDGRLSPSTIAVYLTWIRRWRAHLHDRGIDEMSCLTLLRVSAFASTCAGRRGHRRIGDASQRVVRNSLHAWACALQALGIPVPPWRAARKAAALDPVLAAYAEFRRAHRGVAAGTLQRDVDVAAAFLRHLRSRRRSVATIRVHDVDAFVDDLLDRLARSTVADRCSSLRGFLRFLRATGRLSHDLATSVTGPRLHVAARPPRALPWAEVQRVLRSVPRRRPRDLRDYAMLLMLASYGMGASEVARLRLDDIDWSARVMRITRPKTGVIIEVPLSSTVARALVAYLRHGRPRQTAGREVFLSVQMPYRPVTAGMIRHQVRKYAVRAGLPASRCGSHVFRHSYATRQIDHGADLKVVGDTLGHRRPASTSIYVRVALRRLRALALPVPR